MDGSDDGRSPPPDLRVVDALDGDGRVAELCALYDQWGWWADRDRGTVERALSNTDVQVGLVDDAVEGMSDDTDGRLVAHARVLTDYTYYGRIHDVIVDEDRRGEGVGTRLLGEVVDHPALQDVSVTLLVDPDTVPFYEQVGFEFIGTDTDWETMVYRRDD